MILHGDCLEVLKTLPEKSVQTCVTSPPYWGLRDYGVDGQLGQEEAPDQFVSKMVQVFREVKRVLKDDGTLWLNLGDSYLKSKDLAGIPWRVAFALQLDGWCLRQDIIWQKPNPMPESVKDRCTRAHEYIFLLSKLPKYFFNSDAIKEKSKTGFLRERVRPNGIGADKEKQGKYGFTSCGISETRNRRSVWTVTSKPFKGAHFATFPPDLIEPCILAGSRELDTVLDPFNGAGTTGLVSQKHGRNYIGIELNAEYIKISEKRLTTFKASGE